MTSPNTITRTMENMRIGPGRSLFAPKCTKGKEMTDEQRRQAAVEVLRLQRYQMRIDNLKKQQAELQKEQETLKKKLTSLEKESRQSQKKSLDILYGELHLPRRVLKTLTLEKDLKPVLIKDLDIRYR